MQAYIVKDISHYCNITVSKCSYLEKTTIDFYDLTFVLRGSMSYLADGKAYLLSECDAILLPPGTVRERPVGKERVHYVSFNFSLLPSCELAAPPYLKNVITEDVRKLTEVFSQSHLSQMYHSKQKLCNLLNYILFEIMDAARFESNDPYVIAIEKFIDEHIGERISLDMLAHHLNLSKEYVAFLFKREVGKTVIEYVNERKMLLAKNMLTTGKISLKDVAENLGYDNYGYFSRLFKKHFNTLPSRMKAAGGER